MIRFSPAIVLLVALLVPTIPAAAPLEIDKQYRSLARVLGGCMHAAQKLFNLLSDIHPGLASAC